MAKIYIPYLKIKYLLISILAINILLPQGITEEEKQQIIDQQKTLSTIESLSKLETDIIILPQSDKAEESPKYFGYDYFLKRDALSMYDNLPIPDNYQFGPGDEVIINIWGNTQLQSKYTIDRNGQLYIDKLGQLSIVRMSLSEAEAYLKKRFESVYSTLKNPDQSTFFNLSIGRLKSINVNIIGEVFSPGIHSLHPFSTISTALIQSGGINTNGSLRSIKLIRQGEEKSRLDFYNFLVSGEIDRDDRLQDGDVIFVPIRYSSVEITGEVYRKQIFELLEGEKLGDIFTYCGGLKVNAQKMIEIQRIIPPGKRKFEDFARKVFYKSAEDLDFNLIDGDKLKVKNIFDVNQTVSIKGTIKSPGDYPFISGMTVMDLIEKVGGINDQSFVQKMDLKKVELVRRDPSQEYPIKYEIDVQSIINGDKEQNLLLKNWDVIFIRSNINFNRPESVEISGEVRSPGSYTLIQKIETVNDIINRSGGYTSRAFKKGIKVFRNGEQIILKDFHMPLIKGDKIMVPQHPSVVKVSGEVYNTGLVQYEKGKSIDYYIESAGGFNLNAAPKKITVIYADGDVDIKKLFHNPKPMEGCHIIVQKAEEKEDFDFTEFLKETASILASLVTIIYIINAAG